MQDDDNESGSSEGKDGEVEDVIFERVSHTRKRRHHGLSFKPNDVKRWHHGTSFKPDDVKRSVILRWERSGKSPPWFVYLPWGTLSLIISYIAFLTWMSVFMYCLLEVTIWTEPCNPSNKEVTWWHKSVILSVDSHPSEVENLVPFILFNLSSFDIHMIRLVSPDWWESLEENETYSILVDFILKCHERGIHVIMDIDLEDGNLLEATDSQVLYSKLYCYSF